MTGQKVGIEFETLDLPTNGHFLPPSTNSIGIETTLLQPLGHKEVVLSSFTLEKVSRDCFQRRKKLEIEADLPPSFPPASSPRPCRQQQPVSLLYGLGYYPLSFSPHLVGYRSPLVQQQQRQRRRLSTPLSSLPSPPPPPIDPTPPRQTKSPILLDNLLLPRRSRSTRRLSSSSVASQSSRRG